MPQTAGNCGRAGGVPGGQSQSQRVLHISTALSLFWGGVPCCSPDPVIESPLSHPFLVGLCVLCERFPVTVSQQWSRFINAHTDHLGCLLYHVSAEGVFLGACNFLAFITGRGKCITRVPKLIFTSRKKPIKINNFSGGEKRRLCPGPFVKRKKETGFWRAKQSKHPDCTSLLHVLTFLPRVTCGFLGFVGKVHGKAA